MPGPLSSSLRSDLAKTVTAARRSAEAGARAALETLAVGERSPHQGMSDDDKALRRRLRARGRQLGDRRDAATGEQAIDRLVHEIAYEHWHRLLFARFLAENDLLIHPELGQAITLDEVEELAREQGVDRHALAASYAQRSLPQIFRQGDPVLDVELAVEYRNAIQKLLADLGTDVFTASDSLGWCYQFWQAEKKQVVNASGVKIGADELPAVTQLFTEDYMVDFLLDNTLGAWWAGKVLAANPSIAAAAATEDDLRKAMALPGVPWAYLRFIKPDDGEAAGTWRPAAGTFDGWPHAAKEVTCLDPCMGSGHFVVAMFDRLVPLRMREEGLAETAAIQAVIRDNLYGLEIDPRCTQIGAFNLAIAAWRRVGHIPLPPMHIACSGLAPNAIEDEWAALAEGNSRLEEGMRRLHRLFKDAPVLGSLINPRAEGYAAFEASFAELQPILEKALAKEGGDDAEHEMAVTARGVAKAAEILGRQFTLVATNVPFLGRSEQDPVLRAFCESVFVDAQHELATCLAQRCTMFTVVGGVAALVTPQSWLAQPAYTRFRRLMLRMVELTTIARLGPRAFETITGERVNVVLCVLTRGIGTALDLVRAIRADTPKTPAAKANLLSIGQIDGVPQLPTASNTDQIIVLDRVGAGKSLSEFAFTAQGFATSDNPPFIRAFWELPTEQRGWVFAMSAPADFGSYGGRSEVLFWENGSGAYREHALRLKKAGRLGGWKSGAEAWGRSGVMVSEMGQMAATIYTGEMFDHTAHALIPRAPEHLLPIWTYASSPPFRSELRTVSQKLNITNETLVKVPFDLEHWQREAARLYPDGLPKPHSSDPTQWLFNGHPKDSDNPLHVAVARLVGYQWPRQTGSEFPDCPALGPDGLEGHADADGIVCLEPVKGEISAANRVRALLGVALGSDWSAAKEREFLAAIAAANSTAKKTAKPAKSLEDWLRDDFFTEHCKLFHNRPFVWHLWDGQKRGFHCLVNAHKLTGPDGEGRKTLEAVTYAYLGDWIDKQKAAVASRQEGADALLAAAQYLQGELKKILDGEPPYDLFVRWKPLQEQAIGWDPDINDGVRLNIRPFMTARPLGARAKKACILRAAPGIHWKKDRGNEPDRPKDQFPWFWTWDEELHDFLGGSKFDGNRWNDLHYSNAVKKQARTAAAEQTGGQA